MKRYCVKCGSQNNENDRFCGECGTPLTGVATAQAQAKAHAPVATAPQRKFMRRIWWAVAGIVLLGIVVVAAVFLSGPSSPPQAAALSKLLNANANFVRTHTCLDNFNYGANSVSVPTWNKDTQNWLQVLVDGGIYNPPETIARTSIFSQNALRYTQTPQAKAQIQGKLLCFAKGIVVDTVIYHDVHKSDGIRYVIGSAKYHYDSPVGWTTSAGAREQMPRIFGNDSHDLDIALIADKDSAWQLTSSNQIAVLKRKNSILGNAKVEQDSTFSFGQFFGNLFSSNPAEKLMGKWVANAAFMAISLELRPDTVLFMDQETPVTYELQGKNILVKTADNAPDLLITPISSNEIMMGWQGVNLHFYRVQ